MRLNFATNPGKAFVLFLLVFFIAIPAATCLAQDKQNNMIVIEGPFLRKIPLAVPEFVKGNADAHTLQACTEGTELISSALGFTGYFSLIPKESFIGKVTDAVPPGVVFKDWTAVGADLLITGKAWYEGGNLTLNLRLFDSVSGGLLLGRNYHGPVTQLRQMIYWFCTAMVKELSGSTGFFESRLAFVSTTTGNKEVYVCDFDGQNVKQISFDSNLALSPAWSPDGRSLAYVSYKYHARDIVVANLDRNENVKISQGAHCSAPVFAPEGFTLACSMSQDGNADIYTLTGTGKIIKRMTNTWGLNTSPSWTPDGKNLVFVSNRGGSPQIYILETETGKTKRLSFSGNYNTEPRVSPNGTAIAYTSKVSGRFEIYVMGLNGENPTAITHGQGDNESPTWSPDGSLVAFGTTREGPWRIYVSDLAGDSQRRLLLLPGQQTQPAWSRNLPR